jgi:Zn finger protein HypA/HybF involved in hydrogenase expression
MPVRPQPFTFECGECGWKKTVAPQSDCLRPGEWFVVCPKCGNEGLNTKRAGAVKRWLAGWLYR